MVGIVRQGNGVLELEVDERLHVGRLYLDDKIDEKDKKDGLDKERAAGDEGFRLFGKRGWQPMEQKAQKHENAYGFIGHAPLEEYLRLELMEYLMENLFCNLKGRCTEQHPAGCDKVEGEDAA